MFRCNSLLNIISIEIGNFVTNTYISYQYIDKFPYRCTSLVSVTGTAAMEKEIAEYILSLGRVPIGWEEALFKSNVVSSSLQITNLC